MNITEFLEARIAEDLAAADRRGGQPHAIHLSDVYGAHNAQCPDCLGLPGRARVAAECQAKREVIASNPDYNILEALAVIYYDHPEYDKNWRRR